MISVFSSVAMVRGNQWPVQEMGETQAGDKSVLRCANFNFKLVVFAGFYDECFDILHLELFGQLLCVEKYQFLCTIFLFLLDCMGSISPPKILN